MLTRQQAAAQRAQAQQGTPEQRGQDGQAPRRWSASEALSTFDTPQRTDVARFVDAALGRVRDEAQRTFDDVTDAFRTRDTLIQEQSKLVQEHGQTTVQLRTDLDKLTGVVSQLAERVGQLDHVPALLQQLVTQIGQQNAPSHGPEPPQPTPMQQKSEGTTHPTGPMGATATPSRPLNTEPERDAETFNLGRDVARGIPFYREDSRKVELDFDAPLESLTTLRRLEEEAYHFLQPQLGRTPTSAEIFEHVYHHLSDSTRNRVHSHLTGYMWGTTTTRQPREMASLYRMFPRARLVAAANTAIGKLKFDPQPGTVASFANLLAFYFQLAHPDITVDVGGHGLLELNRLYVGKVRQADPKLAAALWDRMASNYLQDVARRGVPMWNRTRDSLAVFQHTTWDDLLALTEQILVSHTAPPLTQLNAVTTEPTGERHDTSKPEREFGLLDMEEGHMKGTKPFPSDARLSPDLYVFVRRFGCLQCRSLGHRFQRCPQQRAKKPARPGNGRGRGRN